MTALGTVVVGLDGSAASRAALSWAATRSNDPIHVVHAFSPSKELLLAAMQVDWSPIRRDAANALEGEWSEPATSVGVGTVAHLVEEDSVHGVQRIAREVDADTIVVGRHGTGSGLMHGLGSVTRRLLHHCHRPLVIVDPEHAQSESGGFVLACVGYGESGDSAATWAANYAAAGDDELVLLHVISFRPVFPVEAASDMLASYLGGDVPSEWAQADLDDIRSKLSASHPDLSISTQVGRGSTTKGIEHAGAGAELIVLGQLRDAGIGSGIISARMRALITEAPAPVVVMPHAD